jgi:hypothetical protein
MTTMVEVHSKGACVGYIRGKMILEWITYKQGDALIRLHFDRLAMEDEDGGTPLSQLKDGEFLLYPGAIYK